MEKRRKEDSRSLDAMWRLPFYQPKGWRRFYAPQMGMCVQGNFGAFSHTDELSYAYDWSLPTGTKVARAGSVEPAAACLVAPIPVSILPSVHTESSPMALRARLPLRRQLATRDGVVAAAVDNFTGGGHRLENKAKANYVAIRHVDGLYSRYYHLQHRSLMVSEGQVVVTGQPIARSGNTGYSAAPHLHFDVVDRLSTEFASLFLTSPTPEPTSGAAQDAPPAAARPSSGEGATPPPWV